jgi:hypothetical protein
MTGKLVSISLLFSTLVWGQWIHVPTPGLPRNAKGEPVLSAPPPKAADGKPDLSGLWSIDTEQYWEDVTSGAKPGEVILQPAAAALFKERSGNMGKDNPIAHCVPNGVPGVEIIPTPYRIVQQSGIIAILYEFNMQYRQIFTDGRRFPIDPNPAFMGYSVGRWEGDTLVAETVGLKDGMWLDLFGHPTTDSLHVTERFHRIDYGHMQLDIILDDPKAYQKPWQISLRPQLLPDTEMIEFVCNENNRGMEHMVGK